MRRRRTTNQNVKSPSWKPMIGWLGGDVIRIRWSIYTKLNNAFPFRATRMIPKITYRKDYFRHRNADFGVRYLHDLWVLYNLNLSSLNLIYLPGNTARNFQTSKIRTKFSEYTTGNKNEMQYWRTILSIKTAFGTRICGTHSPTQYRNEQTGRR
jgi:hypothetical protein